MRKSPKQTPKNDPVNKPAFEHCAKAMDDEDDNDNGTSGNFKGFIEHRKTIANENII